MIKFVIYLRQFGGITPDTPVFSTNKIDIIYRTEILLFKVVLNINNDNRTEAFLTFWNCYQTLSRIGWFGLGLWCLTPLSNCFRLYRGGQFNCWRKLECPVKTADLPQVSDKLYFFVSISLKLIMQIMSSLISW